jgi:hypothetical protein
MTEVIVSGATRVDASGNGIYLEENRQMTRSRPTAIVSTAVIVTSMVALAVSAQQGHQHPGGAAHHPGMNGQAQAGEMGQGAFAAISEIVSILQRDPDTDWAQVDIGALREHLVDMERLTVDALVSERPIEGGLEIVVGGPTPAVAAARRMVPAHAGMVASGRGWTVAVEDQGEDLRIRWTTADPEEIPRLRALGFFGLMAEGGHHQHHHLMIATGRNPH